ncbi:hypothetical protein ACQ4PT_068551 [Festuca glaucescens]
MIFPILHVVGDRVGVEDAVPVVVLPPSVIPLLHRWILQNLHALGDRVGVEDVVPVVVPPLLHRSMVPFLHLVGVVVGYLVVRAVAVVDSSAFSARPRRSRQISTATQSDHQDTLQSQGDGDRSTFQPSDSAARLRHAAAVHSYSPLSGASPATVGVVPGDLGDAPSSAPSPIAVTSMPFRRPSASSTLCSDMSPSADSARRREICLGKRPVEESEVVPPAMDPTVSNIPFLSASSAPSFVYPGDQYNSVRSSSAPETLRGPFLQGSSSHIRTEYDSPFYMDALACAYESDSSENAFPNESVPPTTAVAATPFVPTEKAIENQRKRKLLIKKTHASKRGRLSIGVSLLPADVSLPLPANYIAALKSAWPGRSFYGAPHYVCIHCGASFWYQERCKHDSTEKSVVYKGCCRGGKISLPVYPDWPHPLKELIRFDGDAVSDHFMRLIREYNAMFAFTSIGVHVDDTVNVGNGPYVFKICGVVAHKIGSLLPSADRPTPKFAQMYIYDTENELDHRMNIFDTVNNEKDDDDAAPADGPSASVRRLSRRKERPDPNIVRSLTTMLNECNPLVQTFRMAQQRLISPDCLDVAIRLFGHEGADHGSRYSLPTAPELAALIVGDLTVEKSRFDIIVQKNSGPLQHVSPLNPSLMALQYPILFPHGSLGFHKGIRYRQVDDTPVSGRSEVTMLEYYCYRFHYRRGEPNPFTCCGKSSHQAMVDSYSCVESCRLCYHYQKQDTLRSETYQGISDALGHGDYNGRNIGVQYLLHSSFTGGRRYYVQNYHDGMAICRVFGAPDLFVTFTCNPKWDEITEALRVEPGQRHPDRPDITTRVFKLKIDEFIGDVKDGTTFGPIDAYLYVVEFQKRGLPHTHTLIWLKIDTRDPTPAMIDQYISAEIPDYAVDPLGYALVEEFMIHGPCGELNPDSPCMKDGVCTKRFPKSYNEETIIDGLGFPVYRRRNNDRYVVKNGRKLDNRWVVSYNMGLLKKFQAHINVEWCNKTNLLKYLFKYLAKGPDKARARLYSTRDTENSQNVGRDEIDEYVKCRYLSTCEACWRTFSYDIHGRDPSVERLTVHMPDMNRIIYRPNERLTNIVDNPLRYCTMLTEWFVANQLYEDARQLTYLEFPSMWLWDKQQKLWRRRVRKKNLSPKIGRIYHVHPTCGELYFLRMLLTTVAGATSFTDLKSYRGVVYDTFKEACQARGLVGDDNEWFLLFDEAIHWASSLQLRHLFVTVLMFCGVSDGNKLLDKFWTYMTDDIAFRISSSLPNPRQVIRPECLYVQLLQDLAVLFGRNGYSLTSFNISTDSLRSGMLFGNRLLLEEMQYDKSSLKVESLSLCKQLNEDQRSIYDQILHTISQPVGKVFFVSGHGGTGKTFLWRAIITTLRANDHIVLAVASSGVASLLLPGGRTAHSRFRIPIDIDEQSMCNVSRGTNLAELIQKSTLILWDEAPMTQRRCFEAVDRSLKDILSADDSSRADLPFGGKTVVLGGDFRQVLPVIEGGSRGDVIDSSLIRSPLWDQVTVLKLRMNMRLSNPHISEEQSRELTSFADWVLAVGDGTVPMTTREGEASPSWICIPNDVALLSDADPKGTIIDAIYESFAQNYNDPAYLGSRAIVCPTNSNTDDINDIVLSKVPGDVTHFDSCDTICQSMDHVADADLLYSPEFLHGIELSNFPHHRISLKIGVPIMLLRNINQSIGLCNGTRLMVTRLGEWVLEAEIMTGIGKGERVCIPRVILNAPSTRWPFTLQRRQYPIRLCYAMTINKSQGQTLNTVGVYLPKPVFSHGQFYVAISRVTSKTGLKILALDEDGNPCTQTRNIVYREVLSAL